MRASHDAKVTKDDYHLLSRKQQVVLVRLRTGHNRLNSHMHRRLKLASSPTCLCGKKKKKKKPKKKPTKQQQQTIKPQSMFYQDAPFTKLQEKMCDLSALP